MPRRRRYSVKQWAAALMMGEVGWDDIPPERQTTVRHFIERRVMDLKERKHEQ
jgi:hypothetical protein